MCREEPHPTEAPPPPPPLSAPPAQRAPTTPTRWHPPHLQVLGDVAAMTRLNTTRNKNDGGPGGRTRT